MWRKLVLMVLAFAMVASLGGVSMACNPAILRLCTYDEDTGNPDCVELTEAGTGFAVRSWRPAVPAYKGGGVYRSSPLAEGAQLVLANRPNAWENMELVCSGVGADEVADHMQRLRGMLEKAADYWYPGSAVRYPVWLEARSLGETNARYAPVVSGHIVEDGDVVRGPFMSAGKRAYQDLQLQIERLPYWRDEEPGTTTCVQTSGEQNWSGEQTQTSDIPTAATDDAYTSATTLVTGAGINRFGNVALAPYYTGIRFRSVAVPQGATILSAFIRVEASANDANTDCLAVIYGEDNSAPAAYSTAPDFFSRILTSAYVLWPTGGGSGAASLPAWTTGTHYDTPDLSEIVQEIVNRDDWASGNDMAFQIWDNKSDDSAERRFYSEEAADDDPPTLYIIYTASGSDYGRAATCTNEAYVANKHNNAQLTHIYVFDNGVGYGANLLTTALPWNLLPAAPAQDDRIYFGIEDTGSEFDRGPFASLVFDIGTAAAYTGAAEMEWEYYDGAAWQALTITDNTAIVTGESFSVAGVNSIHWEQPDDWDTGTINGVTAWWVRAECQIGGGEAITQPTQQNREIYTIVWANAAIDEAQVGGDVPGLARLLLYCESDSRFAGSPNLYASRVIAGLRRSDRGSDFRAYINMSEEQNPDGVEVDDANGAFTADSEAPAGQKISDTLSTTAATSARIWIEQAYASQWRGLYRGYLRLTQTSGNANTVLVQLVVRAGGATYRTEWVTVTHTQNWFVAELGEVPILQNIEEGSTTALDVRIEVSAKSTTGTPGIDLWDLALIPADECLMDVIDPELELESSALSQSIEQRMLDADSARYPRRILSSLIRASADDGVWNGWLALTGSPLLLNVDEDQDVWFYTMGYLNVAGDAYWQAPPYMGFSVQMYTVQRYYSLRGEA